MLLQGEVGRGAALVMVCARDEGPVRDIAHAKIVTEFRHVTKTAYNNYLHERFPDKEKSRIIGTLQTKIGYTREEDDRERAGNIDRKEMKTRAELICAGRVRELHL